MKSFTTPRPYALAVSLAFACLLAISADVPTPPLEYTNCSVSVEKKVMFQFNRKEVDGRAYPQKTGLPYMEANSGFSAGKLEVCVDVQGNCLWHFSQKNSTSNNNLSLEIPGMEEVVKTLLLSDGPRADVAAFLQLAKNKNAEIKDLGNGTVSVRATDARTGRTTVTLVDTRQNSLLGSSVYQDNDSALVAKLVCNPKGQGLVAGLFVFEHGVGQQTGWMTEVIFETGG